MAHFALVRGGPRGRARGGRGRCGRRALAVGGFRSSVAGSVAGQRYLRMLGLGGRGLAAVRVFGLGERQVVGAVPLGAAGFREAPQRGAVFREAATAGQLWRLPLPV